MSNIVLDRIKKQIKASHSNVGLFPQPKDESKKADYFSEEELRVIFMSEVEQLPPNQETIDRVFNGIEEFVQWYLPKKEDFSEPQQLALSSLIAANHAINVGCSCKRGNRRRTANEYFKTFWIKNQETDLLGKVTLVGSFTSISFAVDNQVFLKYPL